MAKSQPKVFLLGRVTLEVDGAAVEERGFAGRQGRLLFAYLVSEAGRPVPRDEIAEVLWGGDPPATWDKALTVLASKVRGALGGVGVDGALTGAFGCYRLELPAGTRVDVVEAAQATEAGEAAMRDGEPARAKEEAARAEPLLREAFLPGEHGDWVEARRRELADLRVRAVAVLADASLQLGDPTSAVAWAEQAVTLDPFRENAHRRLIEALAAAGDRAEALRVYDRYRRLVAEELGAYPSPETDALYRALLESPSVSDERTDAAGRAAPSAPSRSPARRGDPRTRGGDVARRGNADPVGCRAAGRRRRERRRPARCAREDRKVRRAAPRRTHRGRVRPRRRLGGRGRRRCRRACGSGDSRRAADDRRRPQPERHRDRQGRCLGGEPRRRDAGVDQSGVERSRARDRRRARSHRGRRRLRLRVGGEFGRRYGVTNRRRDRRSRAPRDSNRCDRSRNRRRRQLGVGHRRGRTAGRTHRPRHERGRRVETPRKRSGRDRVRRRRPLDRRCPRRHRLQARPRHAPASRSGAGNGRPGGSGVLSRLAVGDIGVRAEPRRDFPYREADEVLPRRKPPGGPFRLATRRLDRCAPVRSRPLRRPARSSGRRPARLHRSHDCELDHVGVDRRRRVRRVDGVSPNRGQRRLGARPRPCTCAPGPDRRRPFLRLPAPPRDPVLGRPPAARGGLPPRARTDGKSPQPLARRKRSPEHRPRRRSWASLSDVRALAARPTFPVGPRRRLCRFPQERRFERSAGSRSRRRARMQSGATCRLVASSSSATATSTSGRRPLGRTGIRTRSFGG